MPSSSPQRPKAQHLSGIAAGSRLDGCSATTRRAALESDAGPSRSAAAAAPHQAVPGDAFASYRVRIDGGGTVRAHLGRGPGHLSPAMYRPSSAEGRLLPPRSPEVGSGVAWQFEPLTWVNLVLHILVVPTAAVLAHYVRRLTARQTARLRAVP